MLPSILSFFADIPAGCGHDFFGLIPWFNYLGASMNPYPDCSINLNLTMNSTWPQIWLIGVAITDDLLRVVGAVSVIFVLYGGIKFVISQGEPENVNKARETVINALIGVAIAFIATGFVDYIGGVLGGTNTTTGLPNIAANNNTFSNVIDIVFGIIGAVSFLMIIYGGFRFVTSKGEPQNVSRAKNTILYALIGIAVSVLAVTIVNFVIFKLSS